MKIILLIPFFYLSLSSSAQSFLQDEAKTYSMPLLTKTPRGEALLSWTEKDAQGQTALMMSLSKDGKNFVDKKLIASGSIGNSRLMRAKILPKKDGSLVAVFMYSFSAPPLPSSTNSEHAGHNMPNNKPNENGRGGRGNGRSSQVAFCISKDNGNTWTLPLPVDTDPTPNLMRGFFDATVLPNDEVAVAYLKDVKNSTKHEERDLRIAITKGGVFQAEKLIDAVVCDCCNISLLVDNKGALNVYYRDNNDNIRDIAKVTSTDNGETFSASKIIFNDHWQINGCPHNGAISAAYGDLNLVAWFSAGDNDRGLRLISQDGKKYSIISEPSAKNASVTANDKHAVFYWEQTNASTNSNQIAYQLISGSVSATKWVMQSNVSNSTGILINNELLMAYEAKQASGKSIIKMSSISL